MNRKWLDRLQEYYSLMLPWAYCADPTTMNFDIGE